MSEIGPSGAIGAPSTGGVTVAAAGPAVAVAGSISAEVGTFSSPTFSGLGRMDAFGTPSMGIPEGPVKGDIFSNMKTIATNPNLGSESIPSAEPVSIFDNTAAFQPTMPVNESPSPFSLENTSVIAKAGEPAADQILGQPEVNVESALEPYLETSDAESSEVTAETLTQAVEDLKVNDPLVYAQLKSDLESVDVILDLVDQVGADDQIAANISNSAIETAVHRSILIQEVIESEADQEPDAEASDRTDNQQTEIDDEIETNEAPPVPQDNKDQGIVRHEEANEARVEHRKEALLQAVQEDVDPLTGKLKGEDILERVNTHDNEQSDLAQSAGVEDGSIPEADKVIAQSEFQSIEEAEKVIFDAVKKNTGVKRGTAGQGATQEEVRKVLKGKPTDNEIDQTLPKAA